MRLAVFSQNPDLYSTRRLLAAAEARGHEAVWVDPAQVTLRVSTAGASITLAGRPLGGVEGVIPRLSARFPHFALTILRQLELAGAVCANPPDAMARAVDSFGTLQRLMARGLTVPDTVFLPFGGDIDGAVRAVGGPPVIVKVPGGSQGVGVTICESLRSARSLVELLHSRRLDVLVQQFVEAGGRDLRVLVIGGRVAAAMRRSARGDEFRANIHRGASAERVDLEPAVAASAVAAADLLGLQIAGVDLLETGDGPCFLEVNASPGLEGIEQASGLDLAGGMIRCLEEQVAG